MNENEATHYVTTLTAAVAEMPLPLEELLRVGERRARQRRIGAAAGSLALVAAVAAVVPGAMSLFDNAGSVQVAGQPTTPPAPTPSGSSSPGPIVGVGVPELEGVWAVEALIGDDGTSLLTDEATGLDASQRQIGFENSEISAQVQCSSFQGTYERTGEDGIRIEGGELKGAPYSAGCGGEPPLRERLLAVRHISAANGHVYLHAENWMIIVDLMPFCSPEREAAEGFPVCDSGGPTSTSEEGPEKSPVTPSPSP